MNEHSNGVDEPVEVYRCGEKEMVRKLSYTLRIDTIPYLTVRYVSMHYVGCAWSTLSEMVRGCWS